MGCNETAHRTKIGFGGPILASQNCLDRLHADFSVGDAKSCSCRKEELWPLRAENEHGKSKFS